uniref:60S ribosomal protein L28 n=1 Tax=Hymenolepis diminuta TaxID=6216 RepID=A0A0R3SIB1_HYMDI
LEQSKLRRVQRLGVKFVTRKAGNKMKPNWVVKGLGDGRYLMRSRALSRKPSSLSESVKNSKKKLPTAVNSCPLFDAGNHECLDIKRKTQLLHSTSRSCA